MNKSAILCVDDDIAVLDSLRKELSEALGLDHLIETSDNPIFAIDLFKELIDDGYTVPIVIADYIMPKMKGDEFLSKIHEINDRTFKIMLTGQAEIQGIANAVNQANLYRILMKPWDYDELVFTCKEAIKNYKKNEFIEKAYLELKKHKNLTEQLKKLNFQYNKLIDEHKKVFNEVLPAIMDISINYEHGFFLPHTKLVIALSLKIADELQWSNDERVKIVITSLLYHNVLINLPVHYRGIDPNFLPKEDIKDYFKYFNQQIDELSKNEILNKYALILSTLWEHYDGSGLPFQLTFDKISKISQVLNLAINYHSGVYRLPQEKLETLKEIDEIEQTPEETSQRHSSTVQRIFKNSAWYDLEIMDAFQRLIKSKHILNIFLEKSLIKVYFYGDFIKTLKFEQQDFKYDKDQKIVIPVEKLVEELNKHKIQKQDLKSEKDALETHLPIKELKVGMIVQQDIVTKFGRLIVPKDRQLSPDDIDEIMRVKNHGLLDPESEIKILVPRKM